MRLLLDTLLLIWAPADDPSLRPAWRAALDEAEGLHVAAAAVWEIAVERALGRRRMDGEPAREAGYATPRIPWEHCEAVSPPPSPTTGDPLDHPPVAQARLEGLTILTADAMFSLHGVALL